MELWPYLKNVIIHNIFKKKKCPKTWCQSGPHFLPSTFVLHNKYFLVMNECFNETGKVTHLKKTCIFTMLNLMIHKCPGQLHVFGITCLITFVMPRHWTKFKKDLKTYLFPNLSLIVSTFDCINLLNCILHYALFIVKRSDTQYFLSLSAISKAFMYYYYY